MTQAMNLANFANSLDSSGQVPPTQLNSAVPISKGGTNGTTAATARTNLGSTAIGDALFTATSSASARTTIGTVIGTNVQAWSTNLDTWATKTAPTGTVVGASDTQTLTNKTLTSPTLTTPNIDSAQVPTVSGTAPLYMCRAWVNFNGTTSSPSTIRASGNVSSVTKVSTGNFIINFSTAMPDVNYTPVCSHDNTLVAGGSFGYWVIGTPTASNIPVSNVATNSGTSFGDPTYACWAFFR